MNRVWRLGKRARMEGEYAGKEEFVSVFESERTGLRRLALLLTANIEAANRCLSLALRECIASNSVSRDWVLAWARRVVIRHAIQLVKGSGGQPCTETIGDTEKSLIGFSVEEPPSPIANSDPILALPDFDRLVFVICVLERYSIHDCALLLSRSSRDVYGAYQRVANRLEPTDERIDHSLRFARV